MSTLSAEINAQAQTARTLAASKSTHQSRLLSQLQSSRPQLDHAQLPLPPRPPRPPLVQRPQLPLCQFHSQLTVSASSHTTQQRATPAMMLLVTWTSHVWPVITTRMIGRVETTSSCTTTQIHENVAVTTNPWRHASKPVRISTRGMY